MAPLKRVGEERVAASGTKPCRVPNCRTKAGHWYIFSIRGNHTVSIEVHVLYIVSIGVVRVVENTQCPIVVSVVPNVCQTHTVEHIGGFQLVQERQQLRMGHGEWYVEHPGPDVMKVWVHSDKQHTGTRLVLTRTQCIHGVEDALELTCVSPMGEFIVAHDDESTEASRVLRKEKVRTRETPTTLWRDCGTGGVVDTVGGIPFVGHVLLFKEQSHLRLAFQLASQAVGGMVLL
jgi:hypothetical protein